MNFPVRMKIPYIYFSYLVLVFVLFCLFMTSKLQAGENGGVSYGYGYISEEKLGSTKIGGQSLFMFQTVAHWKILGLSIEFPLFTRYPYGKNAKVTFLQAKTMIGYRFSEGKGYFFPYFSGGIGFYLRDGVDKNATHFDDIDMGHGDLLKSYGGGIILSAGKVGLHIDYSILDMEYPDGKANHGLFQIGIIWSPW